VAQTVGSQQNLQRIYAAGGFVVGASPYATQQEIAPYDAEINVPFTVMSRAWGNVNGTQELLIPYEFYADGSSVEPAFPWPWWAFGDKGYAIVDLRSMTLVASGSAGGSTALSDAQSAVDQLLNYLSTH
jgi:hypothetical protein